MTKRSKPLDWEKTAKARGVALGGLIDRLIKEGKPIKFNGELFISDENLALPVFIRGNMVIDREKITNDLFRYSIKTAETEINFHANPREWNLAVLNEWPHEEDYNPSLINRSLDAPYKKMDVRLYSKK